MVAPLIAGVAIAGAAMAARGALNAAQHVRANPEYMKQATAAAAGFRGVGNVFKLSNYTSMFAETAGFESAMSRSEAAKVLGVRFAPPLTRMHCYGLLPLLLHTFLVGKEGRHIPTMAPWPCNKSLRHAT